MWGGVEKRETIKNTKNQRSREPGSSCVRVGRTHGDPQEHVFTKESPTFALNAAHRMMARISFISRAFLRAKARAF